MVAAIVATEAGEGLRAADVVAMVLQQSVPELRAKVHPLWARLERLERLSCMTIAPALRFLRQLALLASMPTTQRKSSLPQQLSSTSWPILCCGLFQ